MSLAGPNRKPALTAAASKIGYSRIQAGKLRDEPWQDRAWDVYDKLGPVYYMTRYRSAVARKMDYFAARKDSPGSDPDNDLEYDEDGEVINEGPATKVLEIEGGPELIRRIVSELMVHWDVAGEAYLVRFEESPLWRVLSTQELRTHTGGYAWVDDDVVKEVIDRDNVYRVWKPHPRNHWQADSPTRHVLEDAEGLILSGREIRARSQSRLSAGLWMLPDTVDFGPFGEDENGTEDDFARQLTAHLARPLTDPGSAASLVPWIVTMDRADIPIAKEGFLDFARDWDISIELREEQLNHVALGIDMPPEMATGTAGSMNHWGSWWLTDEAVNMHVLPTVDDILDSLSINWFRPLLEATTVDPKQYVIWRDSSPATVQADQSAVASTAYELGAISGKAYRRAINMDEEDAPDDAELAQRAALKAPAVEVDVPVQGPPIRASVERNLIVAEELADIDADLLEWISDLADLEIERLVNLALTAADDPLDESMLAAFAAKVTRRIERAQSQVRTWLARLIGRTSDFDDVSAREQGVAIIVAGVLETARRKLFTPDASPDPIDTGLIAEITTPTEAIRNGMSVAGGGPAVYENGKAVELIGNGQRVHDELAGAGFFVDGYVWKYGHPSRPFEGHRRLDGTEFTSWEDPQLEVSFNDAWLRRSHYRPGDHKGCVCAFVQRIVEPLPIPELVGV